MSTYGTKEYRQTLLGWEWRKQLDEYGTRQEFSDGWSLIIHTLIGDIEIDNFGWKPMSSRFKKLIPSIDYGTLYWLGLGIEYDKPEKVGPHYTGDAME